MSDRLSIMATTESDEGYDTLEARIRVRVGTVTGSVFTTDVPPEALWETYLTNLPADRRQHYTCNACRRFVGHYGGLVTIDAVSGKTTSVVWGSDDGTPLFFVRAVNALRRMAETAKVTGVFLSPNLTWGIPKTGEWSHLSGTNAKPFTHPTLTTFQAMAERHEEYGMLTHGLADYPPAVVTQALTVLRAEAVYRSEKALVVAEWFAALHGRTAGLKGTKRANIIWAAVATAPPGFCHVRSTIISTLMDDIKAGIDFIAIKRRWAEKLHPLQYQRPTAAPAAGAIDAAEKIVEKLGVAKSLLRRFATLDDVLVKMWVPPVQTDELKTDTRSVFGHLRGGLVKGEVKPIELPPVEVTWEKFARTVLPSALEVSVLVPIHSGPFYGLVTAADPEAPAIIQWDGLEGHSRNPVSHYFYSSGSSASRWHLTAGTWAPVTAVFLHPCQMQQPEKFTHHGQHAFFAVAGAWDDVTSQTGLGLFPEILKAEFHSIRSVIEAHSRKGVISGAEQGTANGLAFSKGADKSGRLTLKVRSATGLAQYTLDRWD